MSRLDEIRERIEKQNKSTAILAGTSADWFLDTKFTIAMIDRLAGALRDMVECSMSHSCSSCKFDCKPGTNTPQGKAEAALNEMER